MKVHLRQFPGDLIPVRRWEKSYEFKRKEQTDNWIFDVEDYRVFDKIIFGILAFLEKVTRPINKLWTKFRTKKYIKVDYDDIWDASTTISMLIVPILKKLKEHKHGSPFVHVDDVPDHLRPTEEPNDKNGWTDNTVHERWEWVLDEIIWTFEQDLIDWEVQYLHNRDQLEMEFVPTGDPKYDEKGMSSIKFNYQKDHSKPAYFRDREGIEKHQERIENGRRLFAKYYGGLWD